MPVSLSDPNLTNPASPPNQESKHKKNRLLPALILMSFVLFYPFLLFNYGIGGLVFLLGPALFNPLVGAITFLTYSFWLVVVVLPGIIFYSIWKQKFKLPLIFLPLFSLPWVILGIYGLLGEGQISFSSLINLFFPKYLAYGPNLYFAVFFMAVIYSMTFLIYKTKKYSKWINKLIYVELTFFLVFLIFSLISPKLFLIPLRAEKSSELKIQNIPSGIIYFHKERSALITRGGNELPTEIYSLDSSGNETKINVPENCQALVSWDQSKIYCETGPPLSEKYIIDIKTGEQKKISVKGSPNSLNSWSRDGTILLFGAVFGDQVNYISALNTDTLKVDTLYRESGSYALHKPVISPDGKKVAFIRSKTQQIAGGNPMDSTDYIENDVMIYNFQTKKAKAITSKKECVPFPYYHLCEIRFLTWTSDSKQLFLNFDTLDLDDETDKTRINKSLLVDAKTFKRKEFIRIYTPKSPDPLKDFKSKFQKWSWFDGKDSLVYLTQKEMKKLNIKTGKVSVVKKYSEKLNLSDFTLLSPDKKWLVYDVSEDRIITVWARNIEEDKKIRIFNQSQNVLSCSPNVACWFGE